MVTFPQLGRTIRVFSVVGSLAMFASGVLLSPAAFGFTPNTTEAQLGELIRTHASQQRVSMVQDPILSMVARAKAADLGESNYTAHTNPDGYGPNRAVQLAGYELPEWWPNERDSNYIESLAFGYATPKQAVDGWLGSPGHKGHVLGLEDFYKEQTRYGVGYVEVPGSSYVHYYVLLTAPPNAAENKELEPYTEWLFKHRTLKQIETVGDDHDADGDGLSRLLEFALDLDPDEGNLLPAPDSGYADDKLAWRIPLRANLGSLRVRCEFSTDLQSWQTRKVRHEAGSFVVDQEGNQGFLRLKAVR